jgi:hypothetical protein
MSNRWADWPRTRWLIRAAVVVLVLVIVWALLVPGADWLAHHDVGSTKGSLATARDAARGRLLTLGAGLFAAGALLFTARNFTLSREGQVTDRYTKAIEQLGSKELDVRIGGIYALERIARDSAKDHPTVMEVLTAFIREHSREQWPPSDAARPEQERSTRPDVQAAVTVAGRREVKRDILPIDLTGANLARANLTRTKLTRANLRGATLTGATLTRADLTGATLTEADLTGATLLGANLTDANLRDATLTSANLTNATLTGADLFRTNLRGANLRGATLTGATLTRADLTGATLTEADLTGATLWGADLTNIRWPREKVPEGWMVDSKSNRLKRAD